MGELVVINNLTLDGVMQAPGRPDEDPRHGFEHGGWARPYADPVLGRVMGEGMSSDSALLFGRRTYEDFAGFWPHQTDGNPFTPILDEKQKYVVSTTLEAPLPWRNSTLLCSEPMKAVAALKEQQDTDLVALGSGELIASLARHGLVDRYVLVIHPLILGAGRRLFTGDGTAAALQLVDSVATTTGVLIATYRSGS